jgi:uncharacterized membrane protein
LTLSIVAKHALLGAAANLVFPMPFVLGQPLTAACTITRYKVVAVPMQPAAINDLGQVVGTTSNHRAALWAPSSGLRELPLPAGFYHSEAVAINNRGHVVGIAYDRAFGNRQSFIFADNVLILLTGNKARAYHIGESDEVAGESLLPGKTTTAPVLWAHGSIRALGGCCGGSTRSINKNDEAIGDAYDEHGRYYAFLWTETSGLRRIGPPDRYSSAIAINDLDHVVIQAFSGVYLYSVESSIHLALTSKFPSHPQAINDCDVIVGSFGPFADADRAFVWDKSLGFQDLNTLIPSDSGWKLKSATGINDRGEIVGKGEPKGEEDSGFLLIPN